MEPHIVLSLIVSTLQATFAAGMLMIQRRQLESNREAAEAALIRLKEEEVGRVRVRLANSDLDSVEIQLSNAGQRHVHNVHLRLLDRQRNVLLHEPKPDLDVDRAVNYVIKCDPQSVAAAQVTFTDLRSRWCVDDTGDVKAVRGPLDIRSGLELRPALKDLGDDIHRNFGVQISHAGSPGGEILLEKMLAEKRTQDGSKAKVTAVPHDWIGDLEAGEPWLERVEGRPEKLTDPLLAQAWTVFSDGDNARGIPFAVDTAILLRSHNVEAPTSLEHLLEIGEDFRSRHKDKSVRPLALATGGLGNPFMLLSILGAAGAEVFGRRDEQWCVDPDLLRSDAVLDSMTAFRRLAKNPRYARAFTEAYPYLQARHLFKSGRAPFLIDTAGAFGMWGSEPIPKDVRVTGLPRLTDTSRPTGAMSIVYGFVIPRGCSDALLAEDLLPEAMSIQDYCDKMSGSLKMPVICRDRFVTHGAYAEAILELCRTAPVMPSTPGMADVWKALGHLGHRLIRGSEDVQRLAEDTRLALRQALPASPVQ